MGNEQKCKAKKWIGWSGNKSCSLVSCHQYTIPYLPTETVSQTCPSTKALVTLLYDLIVLLLRKSLLSAAVESKERTERVLKLSVQDVLAGGSAVH